jgi:hypothetical protein
MAACLITAVAFAASDRRTATFQELQASGVVGDVVLDPKRSGETQIHGQVTGLQPSTTYIVRIYELDSACSGATPNVLVTEFQSNPQGMGNWNKKVVQDITQIESISLELAAGNVLQACADVIQ